MHSLAAAVAYNLQSLRHASEAETLSQPCLIDTTAMMSA